MLFKVQYICVKVGVWKVFQYPLSIFKCYCWCWGSFTTPTFKTQKFDMLEQLLYNKQDLTKQFLSATQISTMGGL